MFYLQASYYCLRVIKKKDYRKEDPQITQINTNLKIACHVLPAGTLFLSEDNKRKVTPKGEPQITQIIKNFSRYWTLVIPFALRVVADSPQLAECDRELSIVWYSLIN